MKPNPKQVKWLKKHLPKYAVPLDLLPRAYCVIKVSTGCGAFATPPMDLRRHLAKDKGGWPFYAGQVISGVGSLRNVSEVNQGDWVSLVYCTFAHRGSWWVWTPPIDLKLCGRK